MQLLAKKLRSVNTRAVNSTAKNDRGIALILVTFIVALAMMIVTSVAYSTFMASRLYRISEQQIRAEYLLKSLLNVARVIVATDPKLGADPPKGSWGLFLNGVELPGAFLGITEPNVKLALEINGEDGKIPISNWLGQNASDPATFKKKREYLKRLFFILGFDNDNKEVALQGPFKGQFFDSSQLVANLIDYVDPDVDAYNEDGFIGIEGDLTKEIYSNRPFEQISELSAIPGFTARRIQKITPHLSTISFSLINVNLSSREVLQAIDGTLSADDAARIFDTARGANGPLTSATLTPYMPEHQKIGFLQFESNRLQVIGKVETGDLKFFLRSVLQRGSSAGDLPVVISTEFYG